MIQLLRICVLSLLAATLALWHERRYPLAVYCGFLFLVFAYTLIDNCI